MNVEFHYEVRKLKSLPRTGWVKRGIPNPETVASHTTSSQFLVYDFAKAAGEDADACARMMLVHDLPEAKAGDMTPSCGVTPEKKAEIELDAAKYLAKLSGNPEFLEIFLEYEAKQTIRAHLCNDADKLDALVQALEYAELYPEKRPSLEEFWPYAQAKLMTDIGKTTFDKLLAYKEALSPVPTIMLSGQSLTL